MLIRVWRSSVVVILVVLLAAARVAQAAASEPPGNDEDCPPGQVSNGFGCEDAGGDGDDEPDENMCVQGEPVVAEAPCNFYGRIYFQPLDAWVENVTRTFMDRPDHPYWEGNYPEGAIVRVYKLTGLVGGSQPEWRQEPPRWIAEFPGQGEPEVDPEELAEQV